MEEGGFTLVRRRSRACARAAPRATALARAVSLVDAPPATLPAASVERFATQIRACADEVRASATWAHVRRALDELDVNPERIVCYGIGSPSLSHIARYQLGMLLLLREVHPTRPSVSERGARAPTVADTACIAGGPITSLLHTSVFDPILSNADLSILVSLGLEPLTASSGSAHAVGSVRTLFFMPHCDLQLYEAVLDANWPAGLARLWVLGNSFGAYADAVVARRERKPTPRLDEAQAQQRVRELQIAEEFSVGGVFNNMSLHAFEDPAPAGRGRGVVDGDHR